MAAQAEFLGIVLFVLVCSLSQGNAGSVDTVGREFVFAYPTPYYPTSRYSSYTPKLYLVITNPTTTDASAEISFYTGAQSVSSRTRQVSSGRTANVTIVFTDYFGSSYYQGADPPKTIRISSSGDVSVTAHYSYNQRYSLWMSVGMIILPVSALGTDHYVVSYRPYTNHRSEFTVSAAASVATVNIRASEGFRKVLTLQAYETFQYRSVHDLTGSRITSDAPVSVISGISYAKVPDGVDYGAYLATQMPSVDAVGMNYILSPFKERTSGYIYRIVGTQDNTIVGVGANGFELHAGEWHEGAVTADNITMIRSDKPIYVCQYMKGYAAESGKGNPAMVLVPGMEMFSSSSVTFPISALPTKSAVSYFISITVKCDSKAGLQVDGSDLVQVSDELQGPQGMCIFRRVVTVESVHTISHTSGDVGFSVMVYASGYKVGYAYMAGYNVRNRTPILVDNSTMDIIPESSKGMSLLCEDYQMTIYVNKSLVIDGLPSDVHLNDAYCFGRLIGTSKSQQWIRVTTLYTECGTIIEENEGGSVYKNTLIYQGPNDQNVIIGRDATFNLPITCAFKDRALASLQVRAELSVIDGSLSGFGNLANVTFTLQMYRSMKYEKAYQPGDFPVTVHVGKPIYLEATASGDDGVQLLVDSCLATHSSEPREKPNYIFIDDGCPTDETVVYYSDAKSSTQRFSTLAFTLNDPNNDPTDIAYIHCWLIACNSSDSGNRCQRDCSNREKRESTMTKREGSSDQYVVSWGPLIILPEAEEGNEGTTADTNFQFTPLIVGVSFFVIGVLVAAFGTITYLRSKRDQHRSPRSWYDSREDKYELLKMEDFYDESNE